MTGFWLLLVLLGITLVAVVGLRLILRSGPGELSTQARRELSGAPMTRLQKRALWCLVIGGAFSVAIVGLLLLYDPVTLLGNDRLRHVYTLLLLSVVVSWAILMLPTYSPKGRTRLALDERDRSILRRAPAVQVGSGLLALAAWAILLTEYYWEQGAIPIVFPYLIFESVVIVYMLSFAAGILIAYRSAGGAES